MSCSINLVPFPRQQARNRVRRRTAWVALNAAAAAILITAWAIHRSAESSVGTLQHEVDTLHLQRAEVQRRLLVANTERTQLLRRLMTVANVRRSNPWARRLAALTVAAPDGICLTGLSVTPLDQRQRAAQYDNQGKSQDKDTADAKPVQELRLRGYAGDHGVLIRLINALQELPDFDDPKLVRAATEALGSGQAVAFEVACVAPEADS